MSEYNKTILTNAGIDLARRANKGAATFQLTRGVSSTENLSEKTIEELQNLTQLPSVQQSVILSDVAGTTDNPDTVIGIRMTFDNQNLKTGYNVHTVGVYAKEPGKDEILYGVATAKTPEYIPDFGEQMLFKFDFLMYLVIGRADKVTVEVSPDDVYRKRDTYNKTEIDAKVSDAVSKLNDKDAEILKNLNDYKQENKTYHQNLEQQLDTKADKSAVNQQLETKADKSTTYTKDEVDNRILPKADKSYVDGELSKKADKATTYTKDEVNSKIAGQIKSVNGHRADSNGEVTLPKLKAKTLIAYDVSNKKPTYDETAGFDGNGNFSRWPVDQWVVSQLAEAINAKLPIEEGPANADLLMNAGNKIVYWHGNGDAVKNLPPMNNKNYFFAVKLFDTNWGSVTVIDQDGGYWINTANGNVWTGWRSVVTNEHLKKLKFVKQSLDQSGNIFQDTKFVTQEADGTFKINIFDSDWTANKVAWLLKNTSSYDIGANTNLNDIKAPGLYHCSGASNIANVPAGEDSWFNMVVNSDNWNGSQALYATNHNQLYIRTWNSTAFTAWRRVINDSDYNNLLPLSGGNMAKGSWITWNGSGANESKDGNIGGLQWNGATDNIKIFGDNNASDNLDLAIQLGDDNSNHISIRDKDGTERAAITADGQFTGRVDWNNINKKPNIATKDDLKVNVVRGFNVAEKENTGATVENLNNPQLVDQQALLPFADDINSIKGQGSYRHTEAVDLNTFTGRSNQVSTYILTNMNNKNYPVSAVNPKLNDPRGTLIVFNFDNNAKTQLWIPVGVSGLELGFAWRYWEGNNPPAWKIYYDTIYALSSSNNALRADVTDLQQRVDYSNPKANYTGTTVNINDLKSTGIYRFSNCTIQNGPYKNANSHWIYLKTTAFDANTIYQTIYEGDNMYGRKCANGSWGQWRRYLTEAI
ncbi:hypothetical protein [Lactobacillus gasseri]|uniref:hypothetical protein n=1 Tax=Lactobacillus gasseri TaxID=1596 RepID=UPI001E32EC26|nr:hypothetical protein [Lactobacillus gasseri]